MKFKLFTLGALLAAALLECGGDSVSPAGGTTSSSGTSGGNSSSGGGSGGMSGTGGAGAGGGLGGSGGSPSSSTTSTGAGGTGGGGGLPSGTLLWAENFGTTYYTTPTSVAIDPSNGDVAATGIFYGTVDFGGGILISDPTFIVYDVFLARFDSSGGYKWAKSFRTGNVIGASGVAVGTSGNVFLAGNAVGDLDLGCGNLAAIGDGDIFLSEFDANGSCLWSKRFGVMGQANGILSMHLDAQDHLLFSGLASGLDLGAGPLTGMYIAKFSPSGGHMWSKAFTGDASGLVSPRSAVDPSGNLILAGGFKGTANFGATSLSTGASSSPDAFVAKFDASGANLWAKQYGDQQSQQAEVVATDDSGNIFVAGDFGGTIDFGSGTMTYTSGETNTFLAKISPSGNGVWTKHLATSSAGGTLTPEALAADGSGGITMSVALAGDSCCFTAGSADFGGGTLSSQANYTTVVLASYDAAGQYRWALSGGPPSVNRYSNSLAIAAHGARVLVGGTFGWAAGDMSSPTSPAGTTFVLPAKTLTAVADMDMFLAALVP